jgi:prepilin-type processing-associated H-X9-DG protein
MEKYKTGYIISYTHNVKTGASSTNAADYPHNDKSTIVFMDFHVAQLKSSKIPDQKLVSSGANEAAYTSFWDPFRTLRANKLPSNNW